MEAPREEPAKEDRQAPVKEDRQEPVKEEAPKVEEEAPPAADEAPVAPTAPEVRGAFLFWWGLLAKQPRWEECQCVQGCLAHGKHAPP